MTLMMNLIRLLLFLALFVLLLPFAIPAFIVGLIMCGLRGGYASASEFVIWLSR